MGFLSWLLETRASPENPNTPLSNPASWLIDWSTGGYGPPRSGVPINPITAKRIATAWACVNRISEGIAKLPIKLMRKVGRDRREVTDHPVAELLDQPHPELSRFQLVEAALGFAASWGMGYVEIVAERRGIGRFGVQLVPRPSDRVEVRRVDGRRWFVYHDPETGSTGRAIADEDMIAITGPGFDGTISPSPISLHAETLGVAAGMTEMIGASIGQGSRPSGVITHPSKLSPEAKLSIRESWQALNAGVGATGKVAVLDRGMDWKQMGFSSIDQQILESRVFGVEEICRIWNMQPHKVQHLREATDKNNVAEQNREHIGDTLLPWGERLRLEFERKLLTSEERAAGYYFKVFWEGLLRAAIQERYESYKTGREWGWLSANDVRELEDQNPIGPEGDVYLVPGNMTRADQAGAAFDTDPSADAPPPEGEDPEANAAEPWERDLDAEQRSQPEYRGMRERRRIQFKYRARIERVARRLTDREVEAVSAILPADRESRQLPDEIFEILARIYREHAVAFGEAMTPVIRQFAREIADAAAREADTSAPSLNAFVRDYLEGMRGRHVDGHLGQLRALVQQADAEADIVEAIRARLGEWSEKNPGKIARRESVQGAGAFTKAVWAISGVTLIRWVTIGKNCPLCNSINGRTVSIRRPFVEKDGVVSGQGTAPLKVRTRIGHPPLHQGCDCSIVTTE